MSIVLHYYYDDARMTQTGGYQIHLAFHPLTQRWSILVPKKPNVNGKNSKCVALKPPLHCITLPKYLSYTQAVEAVSNTSINILICAFAPLLNLHLNFPVNAVTAAIRCDQQAVILKDIR